MYKILLPQLALLTDNAQNCHNYAQQYFNLITKYITIFKILLALPSIVNRFKNKIILRLESIVRR